MTDTPETDGEWNRLACQDHPEFERNLAEFARQLERERDEARDQLDQIILRLGETQERMIDAERQRDEARVLADRLAALLQRTCEALAAWKEARSET